MSMILNPDGTNALQKECNSRKTSIQSRWLAPPAEFQPAHSRQRRRSTLGTRTTLLPPPFSMTASSGRGPPPVLCHLNFKGLGSPPEASQIKSTEAPSLTGWPLLELFSLTEMGDPSKRVNKKINSKAGAKTNELVQRVNQNCCTLAK